MSEISKLSASERIAALLDDSSFVEVGAYVTARSTDFNMKEFDTPKDGVITGYGVIDGKLVYVYSQDAAVLGGSIGEMHAKKIANIYNMAMKCGAPVIGLIDCAGLRLQEATDALTAFGRLFQKQALASGVIPQITAIFGNCGGGSAIIPSLTDFTFMTKEGSKLFVNSPNALAGNYEAKLDTAAAGYVSKNTGLVDEVCDTEADVLSKIRSLVSILPSNNDSEAIADCEDELNRTIPGIEANKDDARAVITSIADDEIFVEVKKDFAPEMVIGFIRMDGMTIGCVGNQAKDGGSSITTAAAEKAAKFVNFCDSFNIPVLTIANAEGFAATIEEEKTISQATARLTFAYSEATVPKVTVVTGKAFGTAYVVMASKSLGTDMVYAWPTAKIGMMDSEMAVKLMYEKEIAEAADKAAVITDLKKQYEETQSSALTAARRGYVDDIIEPDATRKRVIAAFEMLHTKIEERPVKKHATV